jgi:YVTN family beta-propeller protein
MASYDFHNCKIIIFSLFVTIMSCCAVAMADDTTPIAYTANMLDDTASIINMDDNSIIATIYGLDLPMGVAISPDYKRIYVTNSGSNSVAVINATTYRIIDTIPVGKGPYGIGISWDGSLVYVANNEDNTVSVINTTELKVAYTISIGSAPYGIRVNPKSSDVYVTNSYDGTVSVIRGKNVVATIPVGKFPTRGLDMTPDGSLLFVVNVESNNISIINTTRNEVVNSIHTGISPGGIAISPNGWYAYIANPGSGNISILQISDNTIRVSLSMENASTMAVSPDGKVLYVVTTPDGKVVALDSATGEKKGTFDIRAVDVGAMLVNSQAIVDTMAPVTTLKLIGTKDTNGDFIKEVICNLTSVDYPAGTEINNIKYSLDGYMWIDYTDNITIKNPRTITLYYHAIDKNGNAEIIKSRIITIVSGEATPTVAKPCPQASIPLPPKPTALPEEEIYTVTPIPQVSDRPLPSGGFEVLTVVMGMLGAILIIGRR